MNKKIEAIILLGYFSIISFVYLSAPSAEILEHLGVSAFYLLDLFATILVSAVVLGIIKNSSLRIVAQIGFYIGIISLFRTIILWAQQQSYIFIILDLIAMFLFYNFGKVLARKKT